MTPDRNWAKPYRPGVTRLLAFFIGRSDLNWMWEGLASSAGVGSRSTLVRIQPSRHSISDFGLRFADCGNQLAIARQFDCLFIHRSSCARGRAAKALVFQTGQAGSTPTGHSFDHPNALADQPGVV